MWNMFKVKNKIPQNNFIDVVLVFLLLTLNIFHTFFYCIYCWFWTSKCLMGSYNTDIEIAFLVKGHIFIHTQKKRSILWPPLPPHTHTYLLNELQICCFRTMESPNMWQISRLHHSPSVWTSSVHGLLNRWQCWFSVIFFL